MITTLPLPTESVGDRFAVDHILTGDLPATLGTNDAPERYTVSAVFVRRPLPQELDLLKAPSVHEQLAAAGYPRVGLTTGDRRLIITDTNLRELGDGLARTIGRVLEDIGNTVAATSSKRARETAELVARAAERAESVMAEASRIDFSPRVGSTYK